MKAPSGAISGPATVLRRTVAEWVMRSGRRYRSPFADVVLDMILTDPTGREHRMPGFHDGGGTWRVRFNPGLSGRWTFRTRSRPTNPDLDHEGFFEVTPREAPDFLRADPTVGWGFRFEDGTPVLIRGDTAYDLFGFDLCGGDVDGFLRRRAAQGFNLLRVKLTCGSFHPPSARYRWQTRSLWPWGGSPQAPRFDELNLDWLQSVDRTVRRIEAMGSLGLELIMECNGWEFPFNSRAIFTPEWEELWMRHLLARYDAFSCTWLWTPLNEYELYPNGAWGWSETADRWAVRIARWMKGTAPHGHVNSIHNGPRLPPFAERFRFDPEAIEAVMFQDWGATDREGGWLAAGLEGAIDAAFAGWAGSRVLAEWGYERNPALEAHFPNHEQCGRGHTRRGAWRAAGRAMGYVAGFENSWGPWMRLEEDQPGVADLQVLNRFLTRDCPFDGLAPRPDLVTGDFAPGRRPRALASEGLERVVVYFPAGRAARIEAAPSHAARWFDPRSGASGPAARAPDGCFAAPGGCDEDGPLDYALVLRREPSMGPEPAALGRPIASAAP